jgi:phosphoenolpyruvate carboxykinase (ATP)
MTWDARDIFDLTQFSATVERIRHNALQEKRLTANPSDQVLKRLLENELGVKKTVYGSYVANSEPTSRAAMFTKNSVDTSFGATEHQLLRLCEDRLSSERLIFIDRLVGNTMSRTSVRLIVPEHFAHVAYGGQQLFSPIDEVGNEPTYQIVFFADDAFESNRSKPLPEKEITIRVALLEDGRVVKIVRNSNYIGEFKKGVFAAEDWNAKTQRGGIFLHAGCREDYLQSALGGYRRSRTLFLALSANGKTSTTCRILARKGHEQSWLIQNDGGTLMPDGSFYGFEGGGLYVKTESVNPDDQREIYYGLLKPDTLMENVHVTDEGDLDFSNLDRTSNGRAVIARRDVMHTSPHIDAPRIDNIILITRGPLIPAIAKLTCEQAVALMIMGQAMESSAGDPTHAGQVRNEFFYDPFVAGDRAQHANRFYDILRQLPNVKYYLMNTGGIGEDDRYKEITLEHTMYILDSLLRGGFEGIWTHSRTGFQIPKAIRMVDDIYLHPEKLYSKTEYETKQKALDAFRRNVIDQMGSQLNPYIKKVFLH